MAQTWIHVRAEASRGSWDEELASPGLASEVVITGTWGHLNALRSVLGEIWLLSYIVCVGMETGGRRGQEPVVGQTQSESLDDPEGR